MSAITYRKTRQGEWVAFGPKAAMWDTVYNKPCGWVDITKKDGTFDRRQITRLGRSFTADGTECCYAYLGTRYPVPGQHAPARRHGMCDECGERRAVTTATDLSGISGRVCGICARDGSLSFA